MENLNTNQTKENQKEKSFAKLDKFSKQVSLNEAWEIFEKIKDQYNAKCPTDIITAFRSGQYQIDAEIVSIMKIIA